MQALTRTFNFASPWGWGIAFVTVLVFVWLVVVALGGVGFRFDPFNATEKRADRAETRAAYAEVDSGARAQEARGAADTTRRVEAAQRQARQADAVAADFISQARAAPDADEHLSPDRSARLHLADQRLCDARPAVCDPHATAPGDAADR